MGGSNTKAVWLCETIYPSENGSSSIPPEKLQKLIAKGQIPAQTTNEEENLDGDMDTIVDNAIREVWNFYDPKGLGYMDKKKVKQFFNDAVTLLAFRKGCKPKQLLPPGTNMSKAIDQSFQKLDKSGMGRVDFNTFEEFVNECDLNEALGLVTGQTGPIDIDTSKVQMVRPEDIPKGEKPKMESRVKMRDYSALQD